MPSDTSPTGRASTVAAIFGTVVLVILSLMIVVPPPSMGLLGAAVSAAEYSPLIALADLLWLLAARHLLRGHRGMRLSTMTLLLAAGALALWPLARFNGVATRARAQLGPDASLPRYSPLDAFRTPPTAGPFHERVIPYRAADGSALSLRLYLGPTPGVRPTVVVIYGGAWRSGDPSQGEPLNRALASRGYTVASIDYRHAPAAIFPAQLDDVRRSLALLRDSATAWQVDTSRIALLGRSAGGHLAELAAWTSPQPGVRAVIALYAPFDLLAGYRNVPSPDPIDVRNVISEFVGGTPQQLPAAYRAASPSSFLRAGLPPTLLLYGARDHIVKPGFNRTAALRLRDAQVPVVQVEVPWAEHGFDLAPGGLGAQLAAQVITAFLDRYIGGPTP
jgi:acetyl esterase/lipase